MPRALIVIASCSVLLVSIALEQMRAEESRFSCRQDDFTCKMCCDHYKPDGRHRFIVRKLRRNICGCSERYSDRVESLVRMRWDGSRVFVDSS